MREEKISSRGCSPNPRLAVLPAPPPGVLETLQRLRGDTSNADPRRTSVLLNVICRRNRRRQENARVYRFVAKRHR